MLRAYFLFPFLLIKSDLMNNEQKHLIYMQGHLYCLSSQRGVRFQFSTWFDRNMYAGVLRYEQQTLSTQDLGDT